MMTPSQLLYKKLRDHGHDFFVSVPCKYFEELIKILDSDREIQHFPSTREEEGIGILAGAYLGGKRPVMIMQNSGLGNSINALCSLAKYYKIPMTLVLSHRGTPGEKIEAQKPMGEAIVPILNAIHVPYTEIKSIENINDADAVLEKSLAEETPAALLMPISYWSA
jgi:sulfopyruvate decarboxylase subunit alpha